ncbi:MAG: hypothetical protein U0931_08485 [Vulcanimicrobiota bacterium]
MNFIACDWYLLIRRETRRFERRRALEFFSHLLNLLSKKSEVV